MRYRREKGITLAELLVTVAVASLTLSIAVPNLASFTLNNRQVGVVNEFIASLHYARSEAATRNSRITICPSSTGNGCDGGPWTDGWLVFADDDRDRSLDADEQVLRVVDALESIDLDTADFPAFLVYRPNGRVMTDDIRDNSGQFTLCDLRGPDHARVVIVDISGRPRVSDTQMNGSAPACTAPAAS